MFTAHLIAVLIAASAAAAAATVYVSLCAPIFRRDKETGAAQSDDVVFLFHDGVLTDATSAARRQLPDQPAAATELARFIIGYGQRFTGLAEAVHQIGDGECVDIAERPDDPESLRLALEGKPGGLRATLVDPVGPARTETVAHYNLAALRAEVATLRSVAERSPLPTWKRRADGPIVWANAVYMDLARDLAGEDSLVGWPPPDLFPDIALPGPDQPRHTPQRVSLTGGTEEPRLLWFDVIALEGEGDTLFFATPVDQLVRAEGTLSEFVQTLTKTFGHLPIGLAIFDRQRRLTLFNPALVDLTGLPAERLSARPTIHDFLDGLRAQQRIPEPKDYKSWRMQVAHFEAGAADGSLEETWHLPRGQILRVSRRPHPDGAVAYLFEDVSSQFSATRSYRSEIELSRSVVDGLDFALAAFSHDGYLSISNTAYAQLWELTDHSDATIPASVATASWRDRCNDSPAWAEIERRVVYRADRGAWSGQLSCLDGTQVLCEIRPIARGATLVTFKTPGSVTGAIGPAQQDDTACA